MKWDGEEKKSGVCNVGGRLSVFDQLYVCLCDSAPATRSLGGRMGSR